MRGAREIEQLQADLARGEAAHRAWRVAELMDEAQGSPPASLEPLRQALGRAEDDLAILEEKIEETRAKYHHPKLEADIDRAKRAQSRAKADLITVEYAPDIACWRRSLFVRVFWEELRRLGIPVADDPWLRQDEVLETQRRAQRFNEGPGRDENTPAPEIA